MSLNTVALGSQTCEAINEVMAKAGLSTRALSRQGSQGVKNRALTGAQVCAGHVRSRRAIVATVEPRRHAIAGSLGDEMQLGPAY